MCKEETQITIENRYLGCLMGIKNIPPTFGAQDFTASEYDRKPNINAKISIIKIKRVSFLSSVLSKEQSLIIEI